MVALGPHDAGLLKVAQRGAEYLYGLKARTLPPAGLPKAAYYPPRKRYRADRLLRHLDKEAAKNGCDLIVGFTSVDISTTKGRHKDWGIFGLGSVGGLSAVVSTHRLRRKASRKLLARRTVNVVNHELGHVLGSGHVPGHGCLLQDAAGTIRTVDQESGLLCDSTRAKLELRRGFSIPARKSMDWRRIIGRGR